MKSNIYNISLIAAIMMLSFVSNAQQMDQATSDLLLSWLKKTTALTLKSSATSQQRSSAFIHRPDSIVYSFWVNDPSTAQAELIAGIRWKQSNGETVIDRELLYTEQFTFSLTYNYNSRNQVTGGNIALLLGPLPLPAGNMVVNRNSQDNITRIGINLNILGNEITAGDSCRIQYNAENQIESMTRYFFDQEGETGPGWYEISPRLQNLVYCPDGKLCSFEEVSDNGEQFVITYTDLEWFEDADQRFIASYLPSLDDLGFQVPFSVFPQDPRETYLSMPISAIITYPDFEDGEFIQYSHEIEDGEDGEYSLCVVKLYINPIVPEPQFIDRIECFLIDAEDNLTGIEYYNEDLSIAGNRWIEYNDYGYVSEDRYSDGLVLDLVNHDFEVDNGNRLRKISTTRNEINDFSEPSLYGDIWDLIYQGITSVRDEQLLEVFEVFPNPADASLFVAIQEKSNNGQRGNMLIKNMNGQTIFTQAYPAADRQVVELPVAQLQSGVYLVEVVSESGIRLGIARFIKR
jgi:hypothetical protein